MQLELLNLPRWPDTFWLIYTSERTANGDSYQAFGKSAMSGRGCVSLLSLDIIKKIFSFEAAASLRLSMPN